VPESGALDRPTLFSFLCTDRDYHGQNQGRRASSFGFKLPNINVRHEGPSELNLQLWLLTITPRSNRRSEWDGEAWCPCFYSPSRSVVAG
jgi:hypothetical protein